MSEAAYSGVFVAVHPARYRPLSIARMQNSAFILFCSLYCIMIFCSIKHGIMYQNFMQIGFQMYLLMKLLTLPPPVQVLFMFLDLAILNTMHSVSDIVH